VHPTSTKIGLGETGLVIRQRDQGPATIPLLVVELAIGAIAEVNVPDGASRVDIAMLAKVDSALPDSLSPVITRDLD